MANAPKAIMAHEIIKTHQILTPDDSSLLLV